MGQTISAIQPRIFCAGGNKSITGHAGVGKINVIEYINPGTLGDAIDDGNITVDEDALVEGAIDSDGMAHFLATQDGHEEMEEFNGVDYYFYRIS